MTSCQVESYRSCKLNDNAECEVLCALFAYDALNAGPVVAAATARTAPRPCHTMCLSDLYLRLSRPK